MSIRKLIIMFGKGPQKVASEVIGVVDKLVTDKDKKQEIASDIVQNEIVSGSSFVRYARPMIIYTGVALVVLEFFGLIHHQLQFPYLDFFQMPIHKQKVH